MLCSSFSVITIIGNVEKTLSGNIPIGKHCQNITDIQFRTVGKRWWLSLMIEYNLSVVSLCEALSARHSFRGSHIGSCCWSGYLYCVSNNVQFLEWSSGNFRCGSQFISTFSCVNHIHFFAYTFVMTWFHFLGSFKISVSDEGIHLVLNLMDILFLVSWVYLTVLANFHIELGFNDICHWKVTWTKQHVRDSCQQLRIMILLPDSINSEYLQIQGMQLISR